MSYLNEEVFKILKALDKQGVLEHLIVIGSWAVPFYQDYFKDPGYHPTIRTTDIDFLISKKSFDGFHIDLSKSLKDLGFVENFSSDGWVTYSKPELEIQFVCPRIGQQSERPKSIPELGINAQPLRFMSDLQKSTIQCAFQGIKLFLPHPVIFAIHKLVISCRRTKNFKRENDRQQAEMVLMALSDPNDIAFLKQVYSTLTKKERKYILEATEGRPLLQKAFREGCGL